MRGHSSTPLATCSPLPLRVPAPSARQRRQAVSAAIGKFTQRAARRWHRALTAGFAVGALALGLGGCDSGYGSDGYWQQQSGTVAYTGRLAMSWTVNGAPLTTDSCQSQKIDSMTVQIVSDSDPQSAVEFDEVACALSRYSVAMVPIGPVSVYVNAIQLGHNQNECVRYAGIAHGTATAQFPDDALPIDLTTVANCR